MIGIEQPRDGGGVRILREAFRDSKIDEPAFPMDVVPVANALNYIAYGRFEGPASEEMWFRYLPSAIEENQHSARGARDVAMRILGRSIRLGLVRVFEIEEHAETYARYLWEVPAKLFKDGAWLIGNAEAKQHLLQGVALEVRDVVFAASDIAAIADGDDVEAPMLAAANEPRRKAGGRPAGTNGAPIAAFAVRLQTMGAGAAMAETQETLGAWLRQEYAQLGLAEPNEDNARKDAVGVLRQLFSSAG